MKIFVLFAAGWLFAGGTGEQQVTPVPREYQIKAVFLFNFAQFVEWPPDAFLASDGPLVVGVLGNDPFGNYLNETVKGEQIQGHTLQLKHFEKAVDVAGCQILFVKVTQGEQRKDLEVLKRKPILTVSDDEQFTANGGMIRFYDETNRIRFEINVKATKDAGLVVSSKLLRLARLVND